jgi:hypothetical protein
VSTLLTPCVWANWAVNARNSFVANYSSFDTPFQAESTSGMGRMTVAAKPDEMLGD